jgi:hypothetical protein
MTNDQSFETDLAFGDFVIDRADERVLGPDGPLRLGQKAYRVLLALCRTGRPAAHQGRALLVGLGRNDRKRFRFDLGYQGASPARCAMNRGRRATSKASMAAAIG